MDQKENGEEKEEREDNQADYLDKVWENWSSRRQCEKTHVPKFIKKKQEKKSN